MEADVSDIHEHLVYQFKALRLKEIIDMKKKKDKKSKKTEKN